MTGYFQLSESLEALNKQVLLSEMTPKVTGKDEPPKELLPRLSQGALEAEPCYPCHNRKPSHLHPASRHPADGPGWSQ